MVSTTQQHEQCVCASHATCMQCADTRCCCSAVCSDALRMEPAAKRSHHADKVNIGVPQRAPRCNEASWSALSHADMFASVSLLSRAILPSTPVKQQAAKRQCQQPTCAFATTTAARAHVQSVTPQQQLQQPVPLHLHRCSHCRVKSTCRPWSALLSLCCTSRATQGSRSVNSSPSLSRQCGNGLSATIKREK